MTDDAALHTWDCFNQTLPNATGFVFRPDNNNAVWHTTTTATASNSSSSSSIAMARSPLWMPHCLLLRTLSVRYGDIDTRYELGDLSVFKNCID